MKKVILFKIGGFSEINAHFIKYFRQHFSGYSLEVVDVMETILARSLKQKSSLFLRSCLRYWSRILANRQHPRDFFIRFEDAWESIKAWSAQNVDLKETPFTFQTQSLFDASCAGVPHFVYTDHTYLANRRYLNPAKSLPVSPRWLELERSLYHHARVNFTTSEFSLRSIVEDYGVEANHVQCVNSGINVPSLSEAKHLNRRPRRILFAGVDWERKGGPILLKAFLEVTRQLPDAELWIVGCDPNIRMKGVEIIGRISSKEMQQFYMQADVFCLPSKYEPSATVLAEAASYELPVVATSVGGSVERVQHEKTGLLVPPDNSGALAEALLRILKSPELARTYGANGREMVTARFTWDKVMSQIHRRTMDTINTDAHIA